MRLLPPLKTRVRDSYPLPPSYRHQLPQFSFASLRDRSWIPDFSVKIGGFVGERAAAVMRRSRSSRETFQDLELRLGPAYLSKGGMLAASCLSGCPNFVMIEDDEDYEQIYPAVSSEDTFRSFPYSSPWAPAIREEDLELRLGVGASNGYSGNSSGGADTLEGRFKNPNAWKSSKASSSHYMPNFREVKLRCVICMDTMKEETSTLCGHVFCKACITNTIRVQKRCPTCREKLSISNIHRIYLPGATS